MPRITVDLIRKRCEHNEGEISTLEEIALHQENIEKIELIDRLCKYLKILLLQNNLIGKIENLHKFKRLEYLNLAINNIEIIENLEGLESLKKLDLTINFIGDLRGVKKLRCNEHLEQLFLTGNPCTDYPGYRDYVITTLPQLKELDMTEITRSERIMSLQRYAEAEGDVIRGYYAYAKIRMSQIHRHNDVDKLKIRELTDENDDSDVEDSNAKFWNSLSHHTPESRLAIAERTIMTERKKNKSREENIKSNVVMKLFNPNGKPYNINQAKVGFHLNDEDDRENIILEVSIYRHLDTSLVDVDVQPYYIRVTIKGKILQLTLPCEVLTDKSVASRNIITGNLVVTMPRLNPLTMVVKPQNHSTNKVSQNKTKSTKVVSSGSMMTISKREFLEIGPPLNDDSMDFSKIYENSTIKQIIREKNSENFVDNPEVPPLE